MSNIDESKSMTCQPGEIQSWISEEVVGWCSTSRGVTYKDRIIRWIPFPDCGEELALGYIVVHRRQMHGVEPEIDWNRIPVIQIEYLPHVFDVRFLKGTSQFQCPSPCCPGLSCTCNSLWNHFNRKHWGGILRILEELPSAIPKCERCRSQVPP